MLDHVTAVGLPLTGQNSIQHVVHEVHRGVDPQTYLGKLQELEGKLPKADELDNKIKVIETRLKILDLLSNNVKEN